MAFYSIDVYPGDGATKTFALTFEFISRDSVFVYSVDDTTKAETALTVVTSGNPSSGQYKWDSDKQITLGDALPTGTSVKIQRDTTIDLQIVQWKDGSYIIAEDLNTSDKQWLYNLQELEDHIDQLNGSSSGPAVKKITGTVPIQVDSTSAQEPDISIDQVKAADDPNLLISDTDVMSAQAIDGAFSQIVGDGSSYPPPGFTGKVGKLRVDPSGSIPTFFYWNGSAWVQLPTKGDQGIVGPIGPPPGLQTPPATATNVPLKGDGNVGDATATVVQDISSDLQFQFGIPVGKTGSQGPKGDAATVDAGTATSLGYAQPPTVTNSGSTSAAVFNFGIPKGEPQKIVTQDVPPTSIAGEPVKDGDLWMNSKNGQLYVYYEDVDSSQWISVSKVGPQGSAATVDVGSTTTVSPSANAAVTNSGTTSAAIFNFQIPRGDKGDKGETGPQGKPGNDGADSTVPGPAATIGVGRTETLNPGYLATVTNVGTNYAAVFDFGIPRGEKGATGSTGPIGPTATVDAGTATSVSYKSNPSVTNTGSSAAAVFNFGIPKGAPQRCLVQDNPPAQIDGNPVESGDTWFSSKTAQLYVYYEDVNSAQWVSVAKTGPPGKAAVGTSSPPSPTIGELWFDETIDKLKVYTSGGWKLAN